MQSSGMNFSQPTNMQHTFSRVPQVNNPRSQFVSPYTYKTALNAGYIVPFYMDEVLPGDTFNHQFTCFARLATPIKPIMDNLYFDTFYFYVPNRLLQANWEKLNGSQDNPGDSTDFLVPTITAASSSDFTLNSIYDYMGIPPGIGGITIDAFHLRAYNFIWNQFFRDQNMQDSVAFPTDDGPDNPDLYTLLRRGKRHDYFTSCLPFPQKGPAVDLPLTGNAPVIGFGVAAIANSTNAGPVYQSDGTSIPTGTHGWSMSSNVFAVDAVNSSGTAGTGGHQPAVLADLQNVTGVTINQFRQAFQIQMLLENDARGGTRYVEILRAHFSVISPDFRLQRPEYLGGGTTMISVAAVPQTSSTDSTTPQGNLAAYGTVTARNGFTKSFVEHGVVLGLCAIRADLTYQSGIRRMWSRQTRYDFYWPAFAHLGEMAVLNKEIFAQGTADDNLVFGYQEAWADYRYHPSLITGQMRSSAGDTLDIWHLSQEFGSLPALNASFIEDMTDTVVNRIIAVDDEEQFYLDVFGTLKYARLMPVYSTPGLVTRL